MEYLLLGWGIFTLNIRHRLYKLAAALKNTDIDNDCVANLRGKITLTQDDIFTKSKP